MGYKLAGGTVLEYVISRARKISSVQTFVVATTSNPEDDWIEDLCSASGLNCFRGSDDDVVTRFQKAVDEFAEGCEIVVRICADNPFISFDIVSREIDRFIEEDFELYTPFERNTNPFGMSAVVMSAGLLNHIHSNAEEKHHREHVENFILENDQGVDVGLSTVSKENIFFPWLSLTFDTEEDLVPLHRIDRLLESGRVSENLENLVEVLCTEPYLLIVPEDLLDISYITQEWGDLLSMRILQYGSEDDLAELQEQYGLMPDSEFGDVWFFNSSERGCHDYEADTVPTYRLRLEAISGAVDVAVFSDGVLLAGRRHEDAFGEGRSVFVTAVLQGNIGFFVSDNIRGIRQGGIWITQKEKIVRSSRSYGFDQPQLAGIPKSVLKVYEGKRQAKTEHGNAWSISTDQSKRGEIGSSSPVFENQDEDRWGYLSGLPLPLIWMSNSMLKTLVEMDQI